MDQDWYADDALDDHYYYWINCHLSGLKCSDYGGHDACGTTMCESSKECSGAVSVTCELPLFAPPVIRINEACSFVPS